MLYLFPYHLPVWLSCAGIDKWFPLTPIHKDDEVQGEVLVEMNIEQFGEVSRCRVEGIR